ncbi:MAG: hypothetical protein J2P17_27175 [Mycobacterium sp.]|nr:hypothetical protein [Mycobacterium sp.]
MHRMKWLVAVLAVVAAVLVVASPASANSKPTTGTRIGLFSPVTTFPANTPFYVEQGFVCGLGDGSCIGKFISAQSSSTLYVDGVLQPSTVDVDIPGGNAIERRWLTNFPNGLPAGDHTFVDVFTFGDGSGGFTLTKTITFT